jgi:hypothetical protein
VSALASACPHCGEPGISPISKLITSAATMTGWAATCRFCGQRARISHRAAMLQFYIFLAAFATIPWMLEGRAQVLAGYLAAGAIVAVGLFAPMKKDLLS